MARCSGLLRHSVGGDQLADRPVDLRVIVRREPIPTGIQVCLVEQHDRAPGPEFVVFGSIYGFCPVCT